MRIFQPDSPERMVNMTHPKDVGHEDSNFHVSRTTSSRLWAARNHCSFFLMSTSMTPKLARMRAGELKGYDVSGATIHFTPDKPLPATLVTKLVKERIAENEKRAKT